MKKLYFILLITILPCITFSQTVNTVMDNLDVAFYAEYTTVANATGVTFTVTLTENMAALADIAEVAIYRNDAANRTNGRVRIAKGITSGSSGTVIFIDEYETWTEDAGSATGYTGSGSFNVGTPTSYSIKVIMNDETNFNSSRSIAAVYIEDMLSPDANVFDTVNDDMVLWTRVYENYPEEESALLVIGLAPSVNYPSDPYELYIDAIQARTGDDTVNWASYPAFISEVHYNEVTALSGRAKDLPASRVFASNKGVMYHKVNIADIDPDQIAADGTTNVSFKFGRPNSSEPNNGFTYNSLVSIPIQITSSTLSIDNESAVSTVVNAKGNRIHVSDVKTNTTLEIYSITGALVKSLKTKTDIDFSFKPGLWIGVVKTDEGVKSVKLLVK